MYYLSLFVKLMIKSMFGYLHFFFTINLFEEDFAYKEAISEISISPLTFFFRYSTK